MIRVLAVDDSALIRKIIKEKLDAVAGIEIIATAPDPFIAAEKIKNLSPDVVTLDIEMPRMDGITFLKKLMKIKPTPVIMASSLTEKGAQKTIEALDAGAFDFVLKPGFDSDEQTIDTFIAELAQKIKSAGKESVRKKRFDGLKQKKDSGSRRTSGQSSDRLVAIGASTGGTEVIATILTAFSGETPGIVITQHMPPKFTKAFADRINTMATITVKEAENNDLVCNSTAYIAPGGTQMLVNKKGSEYYIEVNDDPPFNRHKPSVDILFQSVAATAKEKALGVILTGMGADGADGMKLMNDAGAFTLAQDEESCIIFGMPKEAIRRGGVDKVANIEAIIETIKKRVC